MRLFYSPDYVLASHAFDTTRKSAWIAASLDSRPISGVHIEAPAPLSLDLLYAVHEPEYVRAVRTGEPRMLAQSQGFPWDPGIWQMVLASTAGVVAAARAALEAGVAGSLSSGLHHARRARGAGFCTFNGLVLAAHAVLAEGARRVLLLDLDAHCGGGSHALITGDPRIWQLDLAVDDFDAYSPGEHGTLDLIQRPDAYLTMLEQRLAALTERDAAFDLCLYNAGMDPHEDCAIGGMPGIDADLLAQREAAVFAWCSTHQIPVAFVLAGGYSSKLGHTGIGLSQTALIDLHRLTIAAAAHYQ